MSTRTFARRFLAETGVTPHQWLIRQRVLAARGLLEETDLPIDEVARRVGFSSPVLLRTHFHTIIGTTPTAYRRRFASPMN